MTDVIRPAESAGNNQDDPTSTLMPIVRCMSSQCSYLQQRADELVALLEYFRMKFGRLFAHSTFRTYYDLLLDIGCVISAIQYILRTYTIHKSQDAHRDVIEFYFATIFLIDWTIRMFLAENKMRYCKRFL